ncbi:hypothetical protein K438DRAFT_1784216 [Mycena galopus ATCC 62051]|nr:hypothetical protein K438DRAFT_1784216 [Mycena galopus ATCC 62051]
MSRASYLRILALGCLDIVITLPISIINLVSFFATLSGPSSLPAYIGWQANHADFSSYGVPYGDLTDTPWDTFTTYLDYGEYAVLAIAIFALFGMTASARSAYWSHISIVDKLCGRKSTTFGAPSHAVNFRQASSTFAFSGPSESETKLESSSSAPARESTEEAKTMALP